MELFQGVLKVVASKVSSADGFDLLDDGKTILSRLDAILVGRIGSPDVPISGNGDTIVFPLGDLAAVDDLALDVWLVACGRLILDLAHDVDALDHASKDDVLVVEMWRRHARDEELRSVGVGACVGHGKKS